MAQAQSGNRDVLFTPAEASTLALKVVEDRRSHPESGIRTYIPSLDEVLLPLRPGELVTVMGRPSNYKSGLMQFWARSVAKDLLARGEQNEVVIYATWEMAVEELLLYDLGADIGLSASDIGQGRINDKDLVNLRVSAMKRAALPLWLVGHSVERRKRRPRLNLSNIAQALMWIEDQMQMHPKIVFLDYLQQIEPEGDAESRRMQIFENVYRCKDMALAMGCPVVLGVQAKREIEAREWKLPAMGDGQESSNIEQSSDKMLSLWMPKTTEPLDQQLKGVKNVFLPVTENLLICGVIKQKLGRAGVWRALYCDPARNDIKPMQVERLG